MATLPYFVLGPSTILSTLGLVRGADPTVPTPAEDWRHATVDVIIPALNEEEMIAPVLASLERQTIRPRRIVLVDDGSSDRTADVALAFCASRGMALEVIRRRKPIGKTPTIKRQALELNSDVEFILDADTVLESPNYIERTVQELYQAAGIASACGTILPLGRKHRAAWMQEVRGLIAPRARHAPSRANTWQGKVARSITHLGQEVGNLVLPSPSHADRQGLHQRPGVTKAWSGAAPFQAGSASSKEGSEAQMPMPASAGDTPSSLGRWLEELARGITNLYREVLYLFVQGFVYHGQMVFFGTTSNPVGCAVAYRRKYVQQLFEHFTPILGDDLTTSEDIFIGLALLDQGYRNVHLSDVYARTVEPPVHRLPKQLYLWSSSFLQSCYYFDPLVKSPLRAASRRIRRPRRPQAPAGASSVEAMALSSATRADKTDGGIERRRIREPYRQAFGRERTLNWGRPAGWMLLMSAVEKIFFPTSLLIMLILRNWWGLGVTVAMETLIGILVLGLVVKGRRLELMAKGLLVAPLRYALLTSEIFTIGRFATDVWITKNRNWRK